MNEVLQQLFRRKSVRAYREDPITPEEKRLILEAACQAPTAGNQQLYTILDITSQPLKEALAITCDNQPFIAKAPLVLVFCADCKKWYDAYQDAGCAPRTPGAGDLLLAVSDAVIAAQNAVVAAESLGIGSCYIGDIMERCQEQRRLLALPPFVFPAAMLVFGRPTRQQQERPKPRRCPLEHIVHPNTYRSMDGAELRQMLDHQRGQRPYEEWLAAFCQRKYQSDFSREMGLQLQHVPLVGVDDGGFPPLQEPGGPEAVVGVDMAVYQVFRLVPVDEVQQAGKPPVGVVLPVAVVLGRGMGQDDVHPSRPAELEPQPPDAPGHLLLGVLVGAAAVLDASPQPQNPQPLPHHQLVLDALAPLRGAAVVGLVVVAVDVQQGHPPHSHQKGEVLGVEVPAGEDQVNAVQPPRLVVIP